MGPELLLIPPANRVGGDCCSTMFGCMLWDSMMCHAIMKEADMKAIGATVECLKTAPWCSKKRPNCRV